MHRRTHAVQSFLGSRGARPTHDNNVMVVCLDTPCALPERFGHACEMSTSLKYPIALDENDSRDCESSVRLKSIAFLHIAAI